MMSANLMLDIGAADTERRQRTRKYAIAARRRHPPHDLRPRSAHPAIAAEAHP